MAGQVVYGLNRELRARARAVLSWARKKGRVVMPSTCSCCGVDPMIAFGQYFGIVAHHPDYSKPLDVEWLCLSCHRKRHIRSYKAQNVGDISPEDGEWRDAICESGGDIDAIASRLGVGTMAVRRHIAKSKFLSCALDHALLDKYRRERAERRQQHANP